MRWRVQEKSKTIRLEKCNSRETMYGEIIASS